MDVIFDSPRVFVIAGAMAAGKSTVAEALARRIARSVHVRGDVFRRMIVNGRAQMGPQLSDEALRQLELRQELACTVVRRYHAAGFTVVYQDILVPEHLERVGVRLRALAPRLIALVPDPNTLAQRDRDRSKTAYSADFPPEILARAFASDLPEGALRIDSTDMTVAEVVERILAAEAPG